MLHPEWTGVPAFVTDVRDPDHPYTYAKPVDIKRNNNTTAYTHSVDVDQDGLAWTSGFGGMRGYYTNGMHNDRATNTDRYATATDPIPYAGGGVPSLESEAQYAQISVEHNSYHRTQAASDKSPKTVTTATGRVINKTDLPYVTQENTVSCTSTSGGGAGRFVTSNLAGSYDGKAWSARTAARRTATSSRSSTTTRRGICPARSTHQLLGALVLGRRRHGRDRLLRPGHPHPRRVRPDRHQAGGLLPRAGRSRPRATPRRSSANNTSAAYWHNGYIYVADYTRGIDVLRYTDPIKGVVQPLVCWNACDKSQTPRQGRRRPDRRRRRHGPGHARSDDGHAGDVRRVHAGCREGLHGRDDGQRHLDRR